MTPIPPPTARSVRWRSVSAPRSGACAGDPDPETGPREDHENRSRGKAAPGITAKDIVLAIIGKTGSAGGTGHVVEFCGEAIRDLSMEGRMTLCNMAIEMGAKAGWSRRTKPPSITYAAVCMRRKARF